MYRSAARRLLIHYSSNSSLYAKSNRVLRSATPPFGFGFRDRFLSTEAPPPFPDQSTPSDFGFKSSSFTQGDASSSSSYSSSSSDSGYASSSSSTPRPRPRPRPRPNINSNYQDEQARVLAASLMHVIRLGWTEAAMIAGARDVGVSPSIVGAIPRKEGALVEYFMDECLQRLVDIIDSGELQLQDLVPSERIAKLVKARLLLQAPYISKWPQAISIQAQPLNFPTSFKQRAMLVDEFWHASSEEGSGVDWYLKRTVLGGIYSTTELYMLTDNSTDFHDTWIFLNDRVRDAFDLKKTFQEVKYFAEAVSTGMGGSLQGFTKKGC